MAFNRVQLRDAITALPPPRGGTAFNRNILLTAMYLRQQARPGTRRAIVIFTDTRLADVPRPVASTEASRSALAPATSPDSRAPKRGRSSGSAGKI